MPRLDQEASSGCLYPCRTEDISLHRLKKFALFKCGKISHLYVIKFT